MFEHYPSTIQLGVTSELSQNIESLANITIQKFQKGFDSVSKTEQEETGDRTTRNLAKDTEDEEKLLKWADDTELGCNWLISRFSSWPFMFYGNLWKLWKLIACICAIELKCVL